MEIVSSHIPGPVSPQHALKFFCSKEKVSGHEKTLLKAAVLDDLSDFGKV